MFHQDKRLERLVPPAELCKQIPEGAFADSAAVWVVEHDKALGTISSRVYERTFASSVHFQSAEKYPAPTLLEIMIAVYNHPVAENAFAFLVNGDWVFDCYKYNHSRMFREEANGGDDPMAAALKLWLDLEGEKE